MPTPSNLYAEKIFAEHPIALWALDDKADYVSLLKDSDRDISLWNIDGGSSTVTQDFIDEPFQNSIVNKIVASGAQGELGTVSIVSPTSIGLNDSIIFSDLNSELATFTISGAFFTETTYLKSISLGYRYFNAQTQEYIYEVKKSDVPFSNQWVFLSETFNIPFENSRAEIVINLEYINSAEEPDSYVFYSNGISMGQWSEEFNSTSLGSLPVEIPESILGPGKTGIVAYPYGLDDSYGYYLTEDNSLLAKNSGMPMVYGADSSTILYPSKNGDPSVIIPSFGVFNESGKNKEYTVEIWMRASCDSSVEKKIFGSLLGPSGLYVEGPFLKLRIGKNSQSYFVGQWSRPMLISIKVSPTSASMSINGESVVSFDFDELSLDFSGELLNDLEKEWLGFWAHEDIYPIEIDAVAIYPYLVADVVSKRRWVYGQGVEFPENINKAYSGTSVFVDFPFSEYSNTYSYPDSGKWNQAILDNLSISKDRLATPNYTSPQVSFSSKSLLEWQQANYLIQNESSQFFTLSPGTSWNDQGHVRIPSLSIESQNVKALYGTFKVKAISPNPQVLFRIEDESNANYLSVELEESTINYILKYGNSTEVVYSTFALSNEAVGEEFSVGINISQFASRFGSKVASFFGNRKSLSVYLAGTKNFDKTFTGNVYDFSMLTDRNFEKIKSLFNSAGVPIEYENVYELYTQEIQADAGSFYFGSYLDQFGNRNQIDKDFWQYVLDGGTPFSFVSSRLRDHGASYSLSAIENEGLISLGISSSSYWEDYVPLTYFAKYIDDPNGDSVYALDFIQFNVDYPAPLKYSENFSDSSWSYSELDLEYSSPYQKDYTYLSNPLATGFNNYNELKNKSSASYSYDTSKSLVRTYISFQYLRSGANSTSFVFNKTVSANKNGVVQPESDWVTTKYEVVDNMIIYPPQGVDFNDLAIVIHLDVNVNNVAQNPLAIRSIELASRALSYKGANPIGTKFGTNIYPYKKTGIYVDYKAKNPMSIYRSSSPYLYLNRNSGISLKGDFSRVSSRGASIPINENLVSNFKMIAAQVALRYDQDFFPYTPVQIFEIQSKRALLKFYLVATHPGGKRARIYAINANTGETENGIAFFINGKRVKDANINIREWNFIGIAFANSLEFSNYLGAIRMTGPISFNAISYYQATTLQEVQFVETRPWVDVKLSNGVTLEWFYWYLDYIWDNVLVISSREYYGVDPEKIYQAYTGTNKIIVDDLEPLRFNSYEYRVHNAVSWKTSSTIPV